MTRKVFTFLLLIALLFHPVSTFAENFAGEVAIANDLYSKHKFQAAADTYESLIQKVSIMVTFITTWEILMFEWGNLGPRF